MTLHPSILRAYDIRGVMEETLFAQDALAIGKAYGSIFKERLQKDAPTVAVGFDGRLSSPSLEEQIVAGLMSTGVHVIRVGRGPTPLLYFGVKLLRADAGIMITGSHNPGNHNGFKMMDAGLPFFGDDITKLGTICADGAYAEGKGSTDYEDIRDAYLDMLLHTAAETISDLRVAWDPGSGAAGEIVAALAETLPGEHFTINTDIDGHFPAHHPDPSNPKNMEQLQALVKEKNCHIGLAFDGDGDRLGVVDHEGNIIGGDHLMMLFAEDTLKHHPGAKIIADVKTSALVFKHIKDHGGEPVMWKTGHSFIKTKMHEIGAMFAGEMSGHLFFKENYGFDDGLYAAVKILNIAANFDGDLVKKVANFPPMISSEEIRIEVEETEKFAITDRLTAKLKAAGEKVNDIDGVRVDIGGGWWLVRASNTQAILVARCEATSEAELVQVRTAMESYLAGEGISL